MAIIMLILLQQAGWRDDIAQRLKDATPIVDVTVSVLVAVEIELDPKSYDYFKGRKDLGYFKPGSLCLLLRDKMNERREAFKGADFAALAMVHATVEIHLPVEGKPPRPYVRSVLPKGALLAWYQRQDNPSLKPDKFLEDHEGDGIVIFTEFKSTHKGAKGEPLGRDTPYPVTVCVKFTYIVWQDGKSGLETKEVRAECQREGHWKTVP
jgi:hypothetical protein